MKWLQISCILIIFAFGLMNAESESNEEGDKCFNQIINKTNIENDCIKQVLNETEFMIDLSVNVIHYSGDNVAIYGLSDKYCPIIRQTIQCTLLGDVDEECQPPTRKAEKQQQFELSNALVNYLCANRSAVLVRILEHNGFETIYENQNFKKCMRLTSRVESIDSETLGTSAELCDAVDKTLACYSDFVREHENKNLIEIAKEFHAIYRQALKCNSTNEL